MSSSSEFGIRLALGVMPMAEKLRQRLKNSQEFGIQNFLWQRFTVYGLLLRFVSVTLLFYVSLQVSLQAALKAVADRKALREALPVHV